MEIPDYCSTIFKRKSVKRYDLTPFDDNKLNEISNHLNNLEPLYDDIKTEVKILPLSEVEVRKKKKEAPHYLQNGKSYVMEDKLIYCEPGKKYVSMVNGDALTATVETMLNSIENKTEMKIKWSGKW